MLKYFIRLITSSNWSWAPLEELLLYPCPNYTISSHHEIPSVNVSTHFIIHHLSFFWKYRKTFHFMTSLQRWLFSKLLSCYSSDSLKFCYSFHRYNKQHLAKHALPLCWGAHFIYNYVKCQYSECLSAPKHAAFGAQLSMQVV
jgi:hypothetical protein